MKIHKTKKFVSRRSRLRSQLDQLEQDAQFIDRLRDENQVLWRAMLSLAADKVKCWSSEEIDSDVLTAGGEQE